MEPIVGSSLVGFVANRHPLSLEECSFAMSEDCHHPLSSAPLLRLPRHLLLALSACCALCLTAAPRARAECGDYVSRGGSLPTHASAPAPGPTQTVHQPAPPRHGPCRGPQCSQGAPTPTVPVSTTPVPADQWGSLTRFHLRFAKPGIAKFREEPLQPPQSFASVIFHPPRPNFTSIF